MLKNFLAKLQKNNSKIVIVPEDFAQDAEAIAGAMNTSSIDAMRMGLDLLKYSLGRDVEINQPDGKLSMKIPILKRYKKITKLPNE